MMPAQGLRPEADPTMSADGLRVLVIDDDADTRANLTDILELDGIQVETAGTAQEALAYSRWDEIAAILLDRCLPDSNAEELLPRLRQLAPHADVLIVTGYADLQGALAALRQGAADYILKPISPDALRASLLRVAERRRLTMAKERSEAAFRALVETAPVLILILRLDLHIDYINQYAEQLTGHDAAGVTGKDFVRTFVPEEGQELFAAFLRRGDAEGSARGLEAHVLCHDGSRRSVLWNAERLQDFEGVPRSCASGRTSPRSSWPRSGPCRASAWQRSAR
jgi:two-component system, LuxR family, sensor kinase FixL